VQEHGEEPLDRLLARADQAMYKAKMSGKGRVIGG
jgi:PleD family two-component response regulator